MSLKSKHREIMQAQAARMQTLAAQLSNTLVQKLLPVAKYLVPPAFQPRLARTLVDYAMPPKALDAAYGLIRRCSHLGPAAFTDAALAHLGASYTLDPNELEQLPSSGPLIIVANHPLGAVDALCLMSAIARRRSDIKILANELLHEVTPLRPWLINVDVLRVGSGNIGALRAAEAELNAGRCLLIFPAGEVSRLRLNGISDGPWKPGFAGLSERANAPVIPVHLTAFNATSFYLAAAISTRLGSLLLPRAALLGAPKRVSIRLGEAVKLRPGEARHAFVQRVRQSLYQLPDAQAHASFAARRHGNTIALKPEPIAAAGCTRRWWLEVQKTELLSVTPDGRELRLARLGLGSALLEELGRVREISFRHVGEGSGKARDLDRFDGHYEPLLLIDPKALEIVGAYRFGRAELILQTQGLAGLYCHSLFEFGADFQARLPHALELGRSFVQPKWFRSRALDELWSGIGLYLQRYPQIRWLFGPVSASATLPEAAREQIVRFYAQFYGCEEVLARARRPALQDRSAMQFRELTIDAAFALLRSELKKLGVAVPPLFKQYTELTELGGVRFLAFGTDPEFANCIDGLVLVDLAQIKAAKAQRWLEAKSRVTGAEAKPPLRDQTTDLAQPHARTEPFSGHASASTKESSDANVASAISSP